MSEPKSETQILKDNKDKDAIERLQMLESQVSSLEHQLEIVRLRLSDLATDHRVSLLDDRVYEMKRRTDRNTRVIDDWRFWVKTQKKRLATAAFLTAWFAASFAAGAAVGTLVTCLQ